MSKASIETYINRLLNGKNRTAKAKVYQYIKEHDLCTIKDLDVNLRFCYSTITGRVSELADEGYIVYHSISDKKHSSLSRLKIQTDLSKIQNNIENRKCEKFKSWVNKGLKEFSVELPSSVFLGLLLIEK